MAPTALVCLGCALFAVTAGESAKKLRNVIITSFGELPYEPMESGFYQSDVIPVSFEDEIRQETMDVALRTRILVEDPNEKKEEEKTSIDDGASSTNTRWQVSDDENQKLKRTKEIDDDFLSPRVKNEYRKLKNHETSEKYTQQSSSSSPGNVGYESRQGRRQNLPRPRTTNYDFNLNREYYGDLGEGWNLQDAEEILQGRNYNILVQTPNSYPKSYPLPPPMETPPPLLPPEARHPMFYPFHAFDYKPHPRPVFGRHGGPTGGNDYQGDVVYGKPVSRDQLGGVRSINRKDDLYRDGRVDPGFQSREGVAPYLSEEYLRGI